MNVARQAALKAGLPVERSGRDGQSGVRIRAAGGGARRRSDSRRLCRHDGGRRHRVDVERAVPPEGRALGLPHGQRRSDRLDAARRADLRDRDVPHGHHGRGSGRAATTCRGRIRTRLPPRASSAPCARSPKGVSRRRSSRCPVPQKKGESDRSWTRTSIPVAGTTAREARRAEAGVQEGRHGDRRQRVGHQRRRRGAVVMTTAEGAGDRREAAGAHPVVRLDRRRSEDHGHRAGPGRPQGARARRAEDRRRRSVRAERSVCGAVGRRRARARRRAGEGQRQRRRDRARPPDWRQRRPRADDADLRAAGAEAALRRRVALHRRRHGYRDGGEKLSEV